MNVFFLPSHRSRCLPAVLVSLLFSVLCFCLQAPHAEAAPAQVRLRGHVPAAVMRAHPMGLLPGGTPLSLSLALPLRDPAGLEALLGRVYDPADPLYGHYLTPAEFTDRFGPTQASYDAVAAFARSRGLTVTHTAPNRLLLSVSGPAATVEAAFGVRLHRYQAADGRVFHAPDTDPAVPASLVGRLSGVIGLDNFNVRHPYFRSRIPALKPRILKPLIGGADPRAEIGSDPNTGALTPSDIKAAYGLSQTPLTGAGQTLAVYELDGYTPSDIAAYETAYGLPNVPLENIIIDGFDGVPGPGAIEVTLDIEVMAALAPSASKILVYEAPNTEAGFIDLFNRIATDNRAKQIGVSWGGPENSSLKSDRDAENNAFLEMKAQGQGIFCASGDSGAYDDSATVSVDDPASQPNVTGVGGTTLAVKSRGGAFQSESAWGTASDTRRSPFGSGGGGGISTVWPAPDYQAGVGQSATQRNVPDVSLDADPETGYAIYFGGEWTIRAAPALPRRSGPPSRPWSTSNAPFLAWQSWGSRTPRSTQSAMMRPSTPSASMMSPTTARICTTEPRPATTMRPDGVRLMARACWPCSQSLTPPSTPSPP